MDGAVPTTDAKEKEDYYFTFWIQFTSRSYAEEIKQK